MSNSHVQGTVGAPPLVVSKGVGGSPTPRPRGGGWTATVMSKGEQVPLQQSFPREWVHQKQSCPRESGCLTNNHFQGEVVGSATVIFKGEQLLRQQFCPRALSSRHFNPPIFNIASLKHLGYSVRARARGGGNLVAMVHFFIYFKNIMNFMICYNWWYYPNHPLGRINCQHTVEHGQFKLWTPITWIKPYKITHSLKITMRTFVSHTQFCQKKILCRVRAKGTTKMPTLTKPKESSKQ